MMTETPTTAAKGTRLSLPVHCAASILLPALLLAGCASTGASVPSAKPRQVTGCRYQPARVEEVYRCSPNPATGGRLVCSYRDERVPESWSLEYETGEPREVDPETCNAEGELKRWECPGAEGWVFLDEPPGSCT